MSASGPKSLWAVGKRLVPGQKGLLQDRTLALRAPSRRSGAVDGSSNNHVAISWFGPETGSTESDQFGHFQVGGLSAGRYDFVAAQQGCTPVSREVNVPAGTTIALTLTPRC